MKIGEYNILVGGDPEVFIFNKKTNKYISAHDRVPGTKRLPLPLGGSAGSVQADGTAVEFNIQPAGSAPLFYRNVLESISTIKRLYLREHEELVATPVVTYDEEYFKKLPASSLELGCSPDFNAYTEKMNPMPNSSLFKPYSRTGAGHVAISWRGSSDTIDPNDAGHFDDCCQLVRTIDKLHDLIRPSYESKFHKLSDYRRQLYGARGAFRPKPWGLEYRTPSNLWVVDPLYIGNMFEMVTAAFALLYHGYDITDPMIYNSVKKEFDFKRSLTHVSFDDRRKAVYAAEKAANGAYLGAADSIGFHSINKKYLQIPSINLRQYHANKYEQYDRLWARSPKPPVVEPI